ncbi:MAG: dienelactone hydrolase family protein [Verrucomicrobiae bacterium]|nr:dienelactone hydrolase family protein [Verrucomicrobiae bacterium]
MKRWILTLIFCFAGVEASWAWELSFASVEFPSGNEQGRGVLAKPDGSGPSPLVLWVPESWGLNQAAKSRIGRMVKEGFTVLAVDLYRGETPSRQEDMQRMAGGLPDERAFRDVVGAFEYLKKEGKGGKAGVIGFSYGGLLAMRLAAARQDVAAAAIFYGRLPLDNKTLAGINCPVMTFFGAEDAHVDLTAIRQFSFAVETASKTNITVRIYERAGHAFLPENLPSYNKAAAMDSWKRAMTFLSNQLR